MRRRVEKVREGVVFVKFGFEMRRRERKEFTITMMDKQT